MHDNDNKHLIEYKNELIANMKELYGNKMNLDLIKSTEKILNELSSNLLKGTYEFRKNLLYTAYNLFIQRVKVGFTFDEATSNASNTMHYLWHNDSKGINLNLFENNAHHLIVGDNYYALQNLLSASFLGKVDIIYIDPPYNTKELQSYKDKFKRDGWLSMIKERLELAKELLSDEGVIFVSIDDSEQAYLKVLMDEIFGEENFIKNLIWQTNTSVMKGSKDFRKDHEYILVYSQNMHFNKMPNTNLQFINPDNDPKGPWLSTNATYKLDINHPNYFGIKLPNNEIKYRTWRFSKKEFENQGIKEKLYFNGNNVPRLKEYKQDYNLSNKTPSTLINLNFNYLPLAKEGMSSFTSAQNELNKILTIKNFTPKPTKLIKWLLDRINNKNALVLDFFAGSGTTGHAVMDLNRKDSGKRKFILCTNNENNIATDVTYERLHRIIKGEGTKGETDFKWLSENAPYSDASLHYYDIKKQDVSLNKQNTLKREDVENLLNKINIAYESLSQRLFEKVVIDKTNWYQKLYNLLLNSNIENKETND